ncbi:MAG TPA: hypothetical protein VG838_01480 [Opitutaceae bacterium]|nr:hypothetical protein [Opitutaceae bacterium]
MTPRPLFLAPAFVLGLWTGYAEEPVGANPPSLPPSSTIAPPEANPPKRAPFLTDQSGQKPSPVSPLSSDKPGPQLHRPAEKSASVPASAGISAAIKRAFPYAPPAANPDIDAAADAVIAGDGVVKMKTVQVTGDRLGPGPMMEERERRLKAQVFNFTDGGRILKLSRDPDRPAELKFKYDAQHKGWDILNIPW